MVDAHSGMVSVGLVVSIPMIPPLRKPTIYSITSVPPAVILTAFMCFQLRKIVMLGNWNPLAAKAKEEQTYDLRRKDLSHLPDSRGNAKPGGPV